MLPNLITLMPEPIELYVEFEIHCVDIARRDCKVDYIASRLNMIASVVHRRNGLKAGVRLACIGPVNTQEVDPSSDASRYVGAGYMGPLIDRSKTHPGEKATVKRRQGLSAVQRFKADDEYLNILCTTTTRFVFYAETSPMDERGTGRYQIQVGRGGSWIEMK